MSENFTNFNLLDPNKTILKGSPWYNNNDEGLGIPAFEDIRSFVELTMKTKNPNFIEIKDGNIVNTSSKNKNGEIKIGGFYSRNGTNYYSTNYTDELMGANNDSNKSYEGFGIKSVEITFDPNKIPQVTIIFYDLRGNVINDFESKYAKMFQLPYPIFTLTIKGGFGPSVDYRLLKIKDDIAIDELGNYIITSKLIGDRFSPLSDLPLLYLMPIPYLKGIKFDIFDNEITSFHELIISSKRLFEKLNSELNSDQEIENQKQFTQLKDDLTNYENKLNTIKDKNNFLNWFKDYETFRTYSQTIQNTIINYVNSSTFENDKIIFPTTSIALSQEFYKFISDVVSSKVTTLNEDESLIKIETDAVSFFDPNLNITGGIVIVNVVKNIKFIDLLKKIADKKNQIEDKGYRYHNDRYTRISNLPNEVLGNTKLTIGNIFKIIINDYNWLMEKIWDVGKQGYTEIKNGARNQQNFDRMGFPTVIQDGNIVYPGVASPEFKKWKEIQFIEEFIDSYERAIRANVISDSLLNKEEDGRSKYIPINPREIYTINDDIETFKNNITNVYYNKLPLDLFKLIYERFLCFSNININIDDNSTVYSKWNNSTNIEQDWIDSTKSFLGLTVFNDEIIKKGLFYSIIEMEARNIAYAISLDSEIKTLITDLSKTFNNDFFVNNKNHPLTKSISNISFNILQIPNTIQPFNDDYVTVSDLAPKLITENSQGSDIISTFMKNLHDVNGGYKITQDNILYIEDNKLNGNNNESIYDFDAKFYQIGLQYPPLTEQVERDGTIKGLFYFDYGVFKDFLQYFTINSAIFDFDKLYNNAQYPALVEVPRGILVILGGILKAHVQETPNNVYYKLKTLGNKLGGKEFTIKKDSKFYKFLLNEYEEFKNVHDFQVYWQYTVGSFNYISMRRNTQKTTDKQIIEYIYQKRFISVNDLSFISTNPNITITNGLTNTKDGTQTLYKQYLKLLLPKIAQFIKEDDKKLNDKLNNFNSYVNDPEVKLSIYKSFQVIYENYLHGVEKEDIKLEVSNNESTSFVFVDRGYNNISGLDGVEPGCILDMKTLLNDVNDYEVSLFSSISRLLSDNNFWFYPFANFLTTTKNYEELFAINYNKRSDINPKFIAMYVGGLSSNPGNNGNLDNNPVKDDGIKAGQEIPPDLRKPNIWNQSSSTLNAFHVKYTGIQNQSVFSNLQVSTESLKNTDEGLRIQSEIVSNGSNNYSIPKGQSLLNVYQKQSYSSTIKIPFGNMGIQPTQYYYQEFIPLFDGLYIIYNVSHSIDSDTQRLETTFKGYRLKKDTNPIVTQQFVDYLRKDIYTQGLDELGISTTSPETTTSSAFNPSDSFWINARRFVVRSEGFVGHIYWDINNWRTGYGSEIMALNSVLKASDKERFDSKNFNKYYIRLPKTPTQWPEMVDLDTGKIKFTTLPPNHVKDYKYYKDKKGNVQWDAARNINNDPYRGYVKNFYSRELSDKAFDYTFNEFLKVTRNVNPTGFNKLSQKAQIGVTYISYGFGSIKTSDPNMSKIRAGIASGNDTTLAIAIIEDLVIRNGNWINQIYYKTAKYIDPDIFNKLSDSIKSELKSGKYKVKL